MAHRIELSNLKGRDIVMLAILAPIGFLGWSTFGAGNVSRGFTTDIAMTFVGRSYTAQIACTKRPPPTLLQGLFGMGSGDRKQLRATTYADARQAFERAFPGCDVIGTGLSNPRQGYRWF